MVILNLTIKLINRIQWIHILQRVIGEVVGTFCNM